MGVNQRRAAQIEGLAVVGQRTAARYLIALATLPPVEPLTIPAEFA